jgi:hypothetical protein
MLRFLFGRLLVAIAVAFTLSIVAFFLLNFAVDNDHSAWGDVSEFSRVGGYPPLHFVLPAFVLGASSVPPGDASDAHRPDGCDGRRLHPPARSKGYSGWRLVTRHAMRNALLPVVSVLAVQLGHKLGGSVVTESVFVINGLERLALEPMPRAISVLMSSPVKHWRLWVNPAPGNRQSPRS